MDVLMNWILFTVFIFGAIASDEEKKIDEDTIQNLVAKTLKDIYDNAEDNLKCMVCYEQFVVSFQFSCGHEVCALCAESIMNKCDNTNCPKCRVPFPQRLITEWLMLLKIYPIEQDIPVETLQHMFPLICYGGNLSTVTKCVEQMGVNVNTEGWGDMPPLLMSCSQTRNLPILEYLINNGANVNQADNKYDMITPLMWSCFQGGYLPVVEYLINNGANVNKANNDGVTALLVSSQEGYLPVVEYLINNGANVDQGINNMTPLVIAILKNHTEIAKLLLRKNANIETARLFFEANKQFELIEILEQLDKEILKEIQ